MIPTGAIISGMLWQPSPWFVQIMTETKDENKGMPSTTEYNVCAYPASQAPYVCM